MIVRYLAKFEKVVQLKAERIHCREGSSCPWLEVRGGGRVFLGETGHVKEKYEGRPLVSGPEEVLGYFCNLGRTFVRRWLRGSCWSMAGLCFMLEQKKKKSELCRAVQSTERERKGLGRHFPARGCMARYSGQGSKETEEEMRVMEIFQVKKKNIPALCDVTPPLIPQHP